MKPNSIMRIDVALIGAVLVLALATAGKAQSALSGSWSVRTWSDPSTVVFGMRYDSADEHDDLSRSVPMALLAGLSRDQLQSGV
jgi:hypothetical protein